ncbi:glycoside hydrolase family 11 protein [Thozetella sp. PMI_491]|nr:glycoside hydrolase family 11 protein [Thozetella sp. PMI_491]
MILNTLLISLAGAAVSSALPADFTPTNLTERGPHDFVLQPFDPLVRRSAIDYNQDYTTGGTVNYSPSSTGFSVSWSNANDFVVGVGWKTGTTAPITFGGSFSTSSGTGLLTAYGWTTSPLVEYYVMESYTNPPTQGVIKGTFTSDGATYTVWENQRVNQPSIVGTATFNQYISIRNTPRTSGTITIQNHFQQWASYGMNLGTFNYQVMAVEGWSGSGSAQQTVSNTGSSSGGGGSSGGGSGSGSCSALYGQCGGIGWTGATCCASGTCKQSNAYYSQCL